MARLNIDDRWFADPRRELLARLVGGDDKVDGFAIRAWRLAQRYWENGKKLVPKTLWESAGLAAMIECDLAEVRDEGIYCRGAKTEFGWIHHLHETRAEAGRKSAAARKRKYGTAIPPHATNLPAAEQTEQTGSKCSDVRPNKCRTNPNALALNTAQQSALNFEAASEPRGTDVWAAYSAAYNVRYGALPIRNAKVNRHCADLVKRLGGDAAVAVVGYFLQHNDAYYVRKSHALGLCLHDAEGLHTQMLTGKAVTAASAAVKDRQQSNLDAAKEAMRILEERDARNKG